LFAEDFKKDPNTTWIMKPAAKGIQNLLKMWTNKILKP
jgi:hypothetical protein